MQLLPLLILTVHNTFTAIWIGGMFVLVLAILPSLKNSIDDEKQLKLLTSKIKVRLSNLIILSIIVLFVTGILLSFRSSLYQGPFVLSNNYTLILNLKHLIYIIMIGIAIFRGKILERIEIQPNKYNRLSKTLLIVNLVLGFLTIILSSYLSLVSQAV